VNSGEHTLFPYKPCNAAGQRTDPPVSDPIAMSNQEYAAKAHAEPEEEAPQVWWRSARGEKGL
jgi:hypothetical protein